jgi:hypothetical protein
MKRFFYAKIDKGNKLADTYLSGDNEIKIPAIPIYFNCDYDNKDDFLKYGEANEQGRNFFECGTNTTDKYILIIDKGTLIIATPSGDIQFARSTKQIGNNGFVKLLPINIIVKRSLVAVPSILASMTSNAYYYTGTFREIRDRGNINAIESVLGVFNSYTSPKGSPHAILECLGSIEIETLVAKILEEHGCFVPAYRGGAIKDADIIACNDSSKIINISGLRINPNGSGVTIQVKRSSELVRPPLGINYLVGVHIKKGINCFDATWLIKTVNGLKTTKIWLKRSLSWLPDDYLKQNGLA